MKSTRQPFANVAVAAVFGRHPPAIQKRLLALRDLVFESAQATPGVGEVEETLKWGQVSYLTSQSKSGTTIRLDYIEPDRISPDGACGIYVHCQTNLVAGFRRRQKEHAKSPTTGNTAPALIFEGNRCVRVPLKERLPLRELREILPLALTYHLRKKK